MQPSDRMPSRRTLSILESFALTQVVLLGVAVLVVLGAYLMTPVDAKPVAGGHRGIHGPTVVVDSRQLAVTAGLATGDAEVAPPDKRATGDVPFRVDAGGAPPALSGGGAAQSTSGRGGVDRSRHGSSEDNSANLRSHRAETAASRPSGVVSAGSLGQTVRAKPGGKFSALPQRATPARTGSGGGLGLHRQTERPGGPTRNAPAAAVVKKADDREHVPAGVPAASGDSASRTEAQPQPATRPGTNLAVAELTDVDPHADLRSRLIAFYNIGFSSRRMEHRHVGRGLPRLGWAGFVAESIRPVLATGYRRVQLHNPFGADDVFPMELDQFQRSRDAGLDWLTEGFVEAWRPVTEGRHTDGVPVEVIAYLGDIRLEPFTSLEAAGDWEAWSARAEEAVRLPLAAGMSLGLDSFSLVKEGSFGHRFVQSLRDRGVKVYIETWPRREQAHWAGTDVVVAESWFRRNHRRPNVFSRAELGDVIRLAHRIEAGARDDEAGLRPVRDRVVEAIAEGYSIAVNPGRLNREVRSLDALFERAEAARRVSVVGPAFD